MPASYSRGHGYALDGAPFRFPDPPALETAPHADTLAVQAGEEALEAERA